MLVPFFLLLWDFHLYLIQLELLLQVQLCEVNQILMEPYPQPWRSNIDQVPLEIRTLLLLIEELIQSLQISFPSFQDDSIRMPLNLNQGFLAELFLYFLEGHSVLFEILAPVQEKNILLSILFFLLLHVGVRVNGILQLLWNELFSAISNDFSFLNRYCSFQNSNPWHETWPFILSLK